MKQPLIRKHLACVENDRRLVANFRRSIRYDLPLLFDHLVVDLKVAHHVAEADALLLANGFDGFVVDLMLPRDQAALTRVEQLEAQHQALLRSARQRNAAGDLGVESSQRRRKALERQVEQEATEVDVDGGIEVLARYANRVCGPGNRLTLPVVIVTARGLPDVRNRCETVVDPTWLRWFEKPVDQMDVIRSLMQMWRI
jgi:CheY-like chemotaxis protein